MQKVQSRAAESCPALAIVTVLFFSMDTKDTARGLEPKAWGPKYLFSSLMLVDGLDEEWIGSTGPEMVVQLLSTTGICFA